MRQLFKFINKIIQNFLFDNIVTITFHEPQTNIKIDDAIFKAKIPEDFDVIRD